jgi:glycosyl hydrolase family 26
VSAEGWVPSTTISQAPGPTAAVARATSPTTAVTLSPVPVEAPVTSDPVALGSYALNIASPWNQSTASGFLARYGRAPAIVHTFIPIVDTTTAPSNEPTNRAVFDAIWANDALAHGSVPLFSHELRDHRIAFRVAQPQYTLEQWIAGANDTALIAWLQGAASWGHRFLYRLGWEMTGWDYTWAVNFPGNSAALYIAFWRHVIALQRQYAPLGEAVWCPSVLLPPNAELTDMAMCWPGADWVDWVGLDGYITGNVSASGPNRPFYDLFAPSVADVAGFAPDASIVICETGVNPTLGVYSVNWLLEIPTALAVLPTVRGVVFDSNQSVLHNPPQLAAFTTIAHDPALAGTL